MNNLGIKYHKLGIYKSVDDVKQNKKLLLGILKTNTLGYDGHGQFILNSLDDIKKEWCFTADYILEKSELKKEISVVITRFGSGENYVYEAIENILLKIRYKILEDSADIDLDISLKAQNFAKLIADISLDYVGTMCVEYFLDQDKKILW